MPVLRKYQGYLIDLDGTIYRGKENIPSAKKFIDYLLNNEIAFCLVTNNTTRTPSDVLEFLREYHHIDVSLDNIYTAAEATADYLDEIKSRDNSCVYVIGEMGLKTELAKHGFGYDEINPDYVVIGLDYDVTYSKFQKAAAAIEKGAFFIGTNPDRSVPNETGFAPGAGSLIKLIQYTTGIDPVIIGKPETLMLDLVAKKIGVPKNNLILFGDNYETDIMAGMNFGIDTSLVLTGVTKYTDLKKYSNPPTFVIDDLKEWNFV